jgi:DMSO/TMAO reductase YedYZ molybdopterin-dependent catalytic subunit
MTRTLFRPIILCIFIVQIIGLYACKDNIIHTTGSSDQQKISVTGEVKKQLSLSQEDIKAFPPFYAKDVYLLKETSPTDKKEELMKITSFRGVLLRDILLKAGMKHVRKYEPGVYFRVKGSNGKIVTFSFGEIFYSSIGRSTLIAYEQDGDPLKFKTGYGDLIVSNDIRNGRNLTGITDIIVERVDIPMMVYEERKTKIVRPPTTYLDIVDKINGKSFTVTLEDLQALPSIFIQDKALAGDCEGFHGVYSFEGPTLRSLLEKKGVMSSPVSYDRTLVICSENGFCATYSTGELFNSRLSNNIIIAYKKDGKLLGPEEAFAEMVAVEDNTGGRSVRRISKIEIF